MAATMEPELRNRKTGEVVCEDEKQEADFSDLKRASSAKVNKYMPAEAKRIQRLIHEASKSAPSSLIPVVQACEPVLALFFLLLEKMLPFYLFIFDLIEKFLTICPASLMSSVLGIILCFFGGLFPTLIAAVEAFNMAGGKQARESLSYVYHEMRRVKEMSAIDDTKDDDKDGIADVDQISAKELFQRKAHLALTALEPDKLSADLACLYTGWVGVVATLKLEFAKTIALGVAIGDTVKKPASYIMVPIFTHLLPEDYHKWIDVIINYIVKTIAISIAWTIQRVISAFHSAIRGGLMFSRGILQFLKDKKWLSMAHEDSYMDEVVGFMTAAFGFYVQFSWRFSVPWILSLLLWPLTWLEWYIVWTISE